MTNDTDSNERVQPATPSAGVRIGWDDVPDRMRAEIERRAGKRVLRTESKRGGFSPGLASVLHLDDGSNLFVKATGPEINPDSPEFLRKEIRVAPLLPVDAPVSRFRWNFDEGPGGWVVLAFDVVDGRQPEPPLSVSDLDLVIEAMIRLADSLTPSPVPESAIGRTDASWGMHVQARWPRIRDQFPQTLDAWTIRNVERLIALETDSVRACAGETLLHNDLRTDNMLITDAGVVIVDWPHARIGAGWIDPVAMAPSLAMQNGIDPEAFLQSFTSARAADPADIDAFLAVITGFFLYNAVLPDPPGLPTLRAFQRAQGEEALRWFKKRNG